MNPEVKQIFFWLAVGMALCAGFCIVIALRVIAERKAQAKSVREGFLGEQGLEFEKVKSISKGFVAWVLKILVEQSRTAELRKGGKYFVRGIWSISSKNYEATVKKSGLDTRINHRGFYRTRALFTFMGFCLGALLGVIFSIELATIGSLAGLIIGWKLGLWALRQESSARKNDLENHLSEMLEVVSLGLRSGLSFDRSFELYHLHFHTQLAYESSVCQRQWHIGLKTREESLRELVTTYDSAVFARVVENVIRSLRFGSSLADSFDDSALEARLLHKARREEEVAKAPVKMLIPTAALILPAMLLLVLGPVMLEMMQGF